MHSNITRLGIGFYVIACLLFASQATAAEPDLRLVNAVAQQDTVAVRALLKEGVDVNTPRADGTTALLWAAHRDDLETAKLLLRAGANVNAFEDHGVTPLIVACENGSAAMVETLLKAGAHANAAQLGGLTPLMVAAQSGNAVVVKALLASGADVTAATAQSRQTALMWALAEGHTEIVRLLIEAGSDVHAQTRNGFTPLLFAAQNGDLEAATMLLAAGVDVNETGSDDIHPLTFSILAGHEAFALFLLERGANANATMAGISTLHAAAGSVGMWVRGWLKTHGGGLPPLEASRRLTLLKALLARGANPNARATVSTEEGNKPASLIFGAFDTVSLGTGDFRGATPLWVASYFTDPDIIRVLLEAGADPQLRTDDQTTPLMVAAGLGKNPQNDPLSGVRLKRTLESIAILIEAGADVNAVNEADFTALHGAVYTGATEPVQYLVDHGADMNKRDFKGRTAYRLAEGAKQAFRFKEWPETAALLRKLGADTTLGIPGHIQERELQRVVVQVGKP